MAATDVAVLIGLLFLVIAVPVAYLQDKNTEHLARLELRDRTRARRYRGKLKYYRPKMARRSQVRKSSQKR